MERTYEAGAVKVLPSAVPLPGLGVLPVNAFLVTGAEPYLVDSGVVLEGAAFAARVEALIPLRELRWLYLTHADPDHIGGLFHLMDAAPQLKLITTYLGLGKLGLMRAFPVERTLLLNPGQRLALADRTLHVHAPPLFDAPETTMVYDDRLDVLFSSDCFGSPLERWVESASDLSPGTLASGQARWASVDAPWMFQTDRAHLHRALQALEQLNPEWICSAHLPPAHRMMHECCAGLREAPNGPRFAPPDQQAFRALLETSPQAPAVH